MYISYIYHARIHGVKKREGCIGRLKRLEIRELKQNGKILIVCKTTSFLILIKPCLTKCWIPHLSNFWLKCTLSEFQTNHA